MNALKILVAGGSGFVGSHLCEKLLTAGHDVHVADCLVTGREKNISHLRDQGLHFVNVDIRDAAQLNQNFRNLKFDRIYNMASPASPIDFSKMPIFILETGSIGHKNLLELGRACGARVLFASSSEVYGDPDVHPQREDYNGNCNPVGPRSCYDEAKRFGEAISEAYRSNLDVDTRIARIFNTYGPRMRPEDGRILPNFFSQALRGENLTVHGDGLQTRSFCYVTDLVAGLVGLMESTECRPCNVGNPREFTIKDVAGAVVKLVDSNTKLSFVAGREEDPKRRRPDASRARISFGWEAQIPFEVGLRSTFEYFKDELATSRISN